MLNVLMQAVASADASDGRAAGAVLGVNAAAMQWGDALFQGLVGLGSAAIILLTVYEKVQNIRLKNARLSRMEARNKKEIE